MRLSNISVPSALIFGSVALVIYVFVPACFNLSLFNPLSFFEVSLGWLSLIWYAICEFCVLQVQLVLCVLPTAVLLFWIDISLPLSDFRTAGSVAASLQVAKLRDSLDCMS